MNIQIPYSWLKDYIDTNLPAEKIAEILSLHSFSVEKITKQNGDDIFEIEVTSNRGDALSVLGIARELRAILPSDQFKSQIKPTPKSLAIEKNKIDKDKLIVEIKDKMLVPRFCAIVLEDVQIKPSPKIIQERLEKSGIRALNNIIDLTNYLMLDKGQPMHAFDFDKIKGSKMILRQSRDGEVVQTLDGVERKLPSGVIVIEDGDGRLIDLCGIMGAKNSGVDENTKKVVLFVQVYDPQKIRKASMTLGHRTEAALRFEKGIDEGGVLPALQEAVDIAIKHADAKVSSKLIDIKNSTTKTKSIKIDYEKINSIAGINIPQKTAKETLENLGFSILKNEVTVPLWRQNDINIPEDLAEEVIRVYGYDKIPSRLPVGQIPIAQELPNFLWEDKARNILKCLGYFECYLQSATLKDNTSERSLELSNPLSQENSYLRTSLIPQLLEVIEKNLAYSEKIKLFELSTVYLPKPGQLPDQPFMLALVAKGNDYLSFKGEIYAILNELGITPEAVQLEINQTRQGYLTCEINFDELVTKASATHRFTNIPKYNPIKEDLTMVVSEKVLYPQIKKTILSSDEKVYKTEFKYLYKDCLTVSVEYLDRSAQISPERAREARSKVIANLEKLGLKLKS